MFSCPLFPGLVRIPSSSPGPPYPQAYSQASLSDSQKVRSLLFNMMAMFFLSWFSRKPYRLFLAPSAAKESSGDGVHSRAPELCSCFHTASCLYVFLPAPAWSQLSLSVLLGPQTCLCFSSLLQRRCKQHVCAPLWVLTHLILFGGLSVMPADGAVFPGCQQGLQDHVELGSSLDSVTNGSEICENITSALNIQKASHYYSLSIITNLGSICFIVGIMADLEMS